MGKMGDRRTFEEDGERQRFPKPLRSRPSGERPAASARRVRRTISWRPIDSTPSKSLPDDRELTFDFSPCRRMEAAPRAGAGQRKRLAIDLSGAVIGKYGKDEDPIGNHIRRKFRPQSLEDGVRVSTRAAASVKRTRVNVSARHRRLR